MFELKLKTGTTLKLDSVEERYITRASSETNTLILRVNSGAVSLETLREAFEAEGALDQITITDETGLETDFSNYKYVQSISRSLIPGGASIQISLTSRPEGEE